MPQSLLPEARLRVVLNCDKHLEKPPTFIFRALTMRDEIELSEKYDKVFKQEDPESLRSEMVDLVMHYLVEWENFPEPLTSDSLMATISFQESLELCRNLIIGVSLDFETKKS
jgi:hypothetical protein